MADAPEILLDGASDDNPDVSDAVLTKDLFRKLVLGDEDQTATPAGAAEAKPPEKPEPKEEKPEPKPEPKPAEKTFTQAELERIIDERLSRDRKSKAVRELETVTGKNLDQILQEQRDARIHQLAYDKGWDEETARDYVLKDEENRRLKAEREEDARLRKETETARTFEESKRRFLDGDLPTEVKALVRTYEKDIAAFSKDGTVEGLDYDTAARYILGTKLPEIIQKVVTATEQRVLRAGTEKARVKPETGEAGPETSALTAEQKAMAKAFDVSDSDYARFMRRR